MTTTCDKILASGRVCGRPGVAIVRPDDARAWRACERHATAAEQGRGPVSYGGEPPLVEWKRGRETC